MTSMAKRTGRRETLNIRIPPEEKYIIDYAAVVLGKNRTDFILDAAHLAAEEALFERSIIRTNPEIYAEFMRRLDDAPNPSDRLRKTLQTPAPWD